MKSRKQQKTKHIDYFKKEQKEGVYHYYEVHGGAGKTSDGFQVIVNFLNPHPIISVEHNYEADRSGLTGTWCLYEVGIPIDEKEFKEAYHKALEHPKVVIK